MNDTIQFETPENVEVTYEVAGLGSRFVAWIEDELVLILLMMLIFILLAIIGMGTNYIGYKIFDNGGNFRSDFYLLGLATLVFGLFNFFYFGISEFLMRGQTIGKKHANIRVVKTSGYALDFGSICVRNAFRVLDHIPVMWLVPFFTPNSQRLGDLVAGTVCITDQPAQLSSLRGTLLARPISAQVFRFDSGALARLRPTDIEAVERIMENFATLDQVRQQEFLGMLTPPLARRMKMEEPPADQQRQFLEDLLASDYRRQQRQLG